MQKTYLAFLFLISFNSWCQELDRSNYELLWEISGNGLSQKSYLFGTFHSNDEEIFDFPDSLYIALIESEAIVLEADITEMMDEANVIRAEYEHELPTGLDLVIPSKKRDEITYTNYGSDEGRPQFVDLYFKQIADNCGKRFFPLESIADQMKIGLRNEYLPDSEGYLRLPTKEEMKIKYLEGNASDLHDLTKLSTRNYKELYEDLIVHRNRNMAEGLDTLMHRYRIFCGVGAAHLLGESGLVPLLREKGYTVRCVEADFSEKKTAEEEKLEACRGYLYEDVRYGVSLQFSGKPKVIDELEGRLVQYQEMGQGNTYSLRMSHYETIDDLDQIAADFFKNEGLNVSNYTKTEGKNGVVYEGKITESNGQVYWMQAFHRNEILYLVYCTGGFRFVNSNRPQEFFESFSFENLHPEVVQLKKRIFSPTKTLSVKFPERYLEHEEFNAYDKYWRIKWFNPNNGESFYVYENVLTDNSMYFTDEEFGEFLIGEFDSDSIIFYNRKSTEEFSEKSFRASRMGRNITGKIRLIGNVLHFAQYTGSDTIVAAEFLNQMNFEGFEPVQEEVKIQNKYFITNVSESGFRPVKTKEKYRYRTTKHYLLNDPEEVITYEIFMKSFEPWAFSQKGPRKLLEDQIIWPEADVPVEIDTTFYLSSVQPYLEFEIRYLSSKNIWKGRTFLNGRDIITYTQMYPTAAEDEYNSLSFLETTVFLDTNFESMQKVDTIALISELISNGYDGIAQLIENEHVQENTILEILFMEDSVFQIADKNGRFQAFLVENISSLYFSDSLIDLWKRRADNENILFTEQLIKSYSQFPEELSHILDYAESMDLNWTNTEEIFELVTKDPKTFIAVKNVFEERMKDSLTWRMTFIIEDLIEQDFYRNYFLSDEFSSIALREGQSDWVPFRYFELFYESGQNRDEMRALIQSWKAGENIFNFGVKTAWKEVLDLKNSRKEKQKIRKNVVASTSYAKVMAVSNQKKSALFSFEEILGLIAVDHYKSEDSDYKEMIEHLGNKKGYAFYQFSEKNQIFYMARRIPDDNKLPSYKDFGSDTYFFQFNNKPSIDQLQQRLEKALAQIGKEI